MSEPGTGPGTGKATAELFEQVILRRLGSKDPDILVGPQHGVDVGVVRVADGVAMALTTDPVFVVPAYGWERAAWFAVHILASLLCAVAPNVAVLGALRVLQDVPLGHVELAVISVGLVSFGVYLMTRARHLRQ